MHVGIPTNGRRGSAMVAMRTAGRRCLALGLVVLLSTLSGCTALSTVYIANFEGGAEVRGVCPNEQFKSIRLFTLPREDSTYDDAVTRWRIVRVEGGITGPVIIGAQDVPGYRTDVPLDPAVESGYVEVEYPNGSHSTAIPWAADAAPGTVVWEGGTEPQWYFDAMRPTRPFVCG